MKSGRTKWNRSSKILSNAASKRTVQQVRRAEAPDSGELPGGEAGRESPVIRVPAGILMNDMLSELSLGKSPEGAFSVKDNTDCHTGNRPRITMSEQRQNLPYPELLQHSTFVAVPDGITDNTIGRMDLEQERLRKNVLARMRRIEGQIRGIQRMIENGDECSDILMQVRAARAALHAAGRQVMKRYLIRCHIEMLTESDNATESMGKIVEMLVGYLD